MKVTIALSTIPTTFPAGTALGQYRIRLAKGMIPHYTIYADAPLPAEVVFPNVAAGEYMLEVVRLNTGAIPVGQAFGQPLTVAEPPPVSADQVVGAVVTVV